MADPLIGRLLDGRYRVESRLARGGMATVYEAVDTRLERPVALKVMHPGLAEDQAFVSRFIREARSAARLTHPGVVAVYDQGQDHGSVFLAMEYVPGRTLRDLLRERGRLTPREALDVLEPVLSALSAAHRAGIVHRDVKPENVLLADDGRVKVADFGLARSSLASEASGSTQGVVMGTVAYLSPEQVDRGIADPRSDVYACGIVLYEMLTGRPPFSGGTPIAVAYQHVTADVAPPSAAVHGLPPALDDVVFTATARDPDLRPADAGALLRTIQDVRARLTPAELAFAADTVDLTKTLVVPVPGGRAAFGGAATTALAAPPAPPGVGVSHTGPVGGPPRIPRAARHGGSRRRALIGVLVLVLVAALVGGGAWLLGSARSTATPSVVGLSRSAAAERISAAGLKVAYTSQHSETVKPGYVLRTDPSANGRIDKGGTVTVTLSSGPERFAVPQLVGDNVSDARAALVAAHLAVGTQTTQYSETVTSGTVVSTDPASGAMLRRDSPVRLVISKGVPPATVPSFAGKQLSDAQALAQQDKLGLASAPQGAYSMTVPKNAVVSQSIPAGQQVPRGTTVTVVVSLGPPLVEVPDVFRMDKDKAKQILEKAGFVVVFTEPFGVTPFNQVYSEDPAGGTKAPKGSTIHLGIV